MTIDTPDNNPQMPDREPNPPEIPKELASEIVPKSIHLTQELLDFLAANGIDVSPKVIDTIFLGNVRERFHHGKMANMRVTGDGELIYHYKETETSDWETVKITYPGLTKEQVYLIALAINSRRVQEILLGELERYLPENRYRAFPPFNRAVAINYLARIGELQDLLEKCKAQRIKEANSRKAVPVPVPSTLSPKHDDDAIAELHLAYKRDRPWNIMQGLILGAVITLVALYLFGLLYSPHEDIFDQLKNGHLHGGQPNQEGFLK